MNPAAAFWLAGAAIWAVLVVVIVAGAVRAAVEVLRTGGRS